MAPSRIVLRNGEVLLGWAVSLSMLGIVTYVGGPLLLHGSPRWLDTAIPLAIMAIVVVESSRQVYVALTIDGDEAEILEIGLFRWRRRRFPCRSLKPLQKRGKDEEGMAIDRCWIELPDGSRVCLGRDYPWTSRSTFARLRTALGH
ncbi:hypothetical protein [Ancylobacter oerskovii]|uniref:PH (Pleckstrin Homology) domain-containing protein n=1 Tax=Ancylobacter oerskovii TaxID=459519 RepID=A0ABW4YV88_9HYPH|nr:hypothetical protein [Ancylobacter oerskovii]MBS7543185.1 hypothetical protein [Ancylobacter oerskovii]